MGDEFSSGGKHIPDNSAFDTWSVMYNEDVSAKQHKGYPFEGYHATLTCIQNKVRTAKASSVLDIGIGTGLLSNPLYDDGITVTDVDFSAGMLQVAQTSMPEARFIRHDFSTGLPGQLKYDTFDCIISSYAFHHIDDRTKVKFITDLIQNLSSGGTILIGDVAFKTRCDMLGVQAEADKWDAHEYYIVADEITSELARHQLKSVFLKTSMCSGVLMIQA